MNPFFNGYDPNQGIMRQKKKRPTGGALYSGGAGGGHLLPGIERLDPRQINSASLMDVVGSAVNAGTKIASVAGSGGANAALTIGGNLANSAIKRLTAGNAPDPVSQYHKSYSDFVPVTGRRDTFGYANQGVGGQAVEKLQRMRRGPTTKMDVAKKVFDHVNTAIDYATGNFKDGGSVCLKKQSKFEGNPQSKKVQNFLNNFK